MKLVEQLGQSGDLLFTRTWFLPVIVSLATILYYGRIAAREEAFLEGRFGDAFRRWAARVPAAVPRLRGWQSAVLPFSWERALGHEFYAIGEVSVAFFVLDMLEDWTVTHRLTIDPVWTAVAVVGGAFFVVMRIRKKRRAASRG